MPLTLSVPDNICYIADQRSLFAACGGRASGLSALTSDFSTADSVTALPSASFLPRHRRLDARRRRPHHRQLRQQGERASLRAARALVLDAAQSPPLLDEGARTLSSSIWEQVGR